MKLRWIVNIGLALLLGLSSGETHGQGRFNYLKEPNVIWEDNRLAGELKNVPVSGLLQDLLQGPNDRCLIEGVLPGMISLRFENTTPEELVRNIMRNKGYNYVLISNDSRSRQPSTLTAIRELIIFQGESAVRFQRVPRNSSHGTKEHSHRTAPASAVHRTGGRDGKALPMNDAKRSELDNEIRLFMDRLRATGQISEAQYEKRLKEVMAGQN